MITGFALDFGPTGAAETTGATTGATGAAAGAGACATSAFAPLGENAE